MPLICPSTPPTAALTPAEFLRLDTTCLGSATLTIVGWEAAPVPFEVWPPVIGPGWLSLWSDATKSVLWQDQFDSSWRCGGPDQCPWILVHIPPDSPLTFNAKGKWVRVTGHVNDPASDGCYFYGPPEMSPFPDVSLAEASCRQNFVVDTIEATSGP